MRIRILPYILALLFAGCRDYEVDDNPQVHDSADDIHVGAVTDGLSIRVDNSMTRADGDEGNADQEIRQDAENVSWLLSPLFNGLQIRYGHGDTEKVAVLRLLRKDGATGETHDDIKYSTYTEEGVSKQLAEYSFRYYDTSKDNKEGENAQWMGNGDHYFHGVYVPKELKYSNGEASTVYDPTNGTARSLTTDQSQAGVSGSTVGNYTLLERYLAMPANQTIKATVSRIKLPFSHRLARVLVFVLIDPTLGDAKLNGYNYKKEVVDGETVVTPDNPSTTKLYFGNVRVLAGVKELTEANGIQRLHPQWAQPRLVTPHFIDEVGCVDQQLKPIPGYEHDHFILYYNIEDKEYIYPTSSKWPAAKTAWDNKYNAYLPQHPDKKSEAIEYADANSGYRRTVYGTVPVYDIIVQPTYTDKKMVVYDEDLSVHDVAWYATQKNKIDFELTLDNGLNYSRSVDIDLDANYQTAIFLRVNAESVDYSKSGSEKWTSEDSNDDYYGVNNKNGNTLSYAGSSWQRAYRIGSNDWNVTDGHWYGKTDGTDGTDDAMPNYQQYVTQAQWLEMFAEAYEGGKHHGDYFILDGHITIDATTLPRDFVFTGHLDGQNHTISLINSGVDLYKDATSIENLFTKKDGNYTPYSVPSLYRKNDTRQYYGEDEIIEVSGKTYVKSTVVITPATYYTQEDIDAALAIVKADGYTTGDNPEADVTATKNAGDVKTPEQYDTSNATEANVGHVKEGTLSYDPVTVTLEILLGDEELYVKENEEYKEFVHPTALYQFSHTSPSHLFDGLDGKYKTAQELVGASSTTVWEANVHKENGKWVPVAGYRAELMNVKLASGATFFPVDAVFTQDDLNTSDAIVSGYIVNCWEGNNKISNRVPIPQY